MLLAIAFAMLVAPPNPNPWELAKDSAEIKVWARDVPGSAVREVRAEAVIQSSAARIYEVLCDVEHFVEFMPYLVEAKKLGPAPGGGQYEYERLDPPIVDMRDYTLHITETIDAEHGLYVRSWTSANDKGPAARQDAVRVLINEGSWTVEKVTDASANVTYYLHTDPGGAIPAWLTNRANTKSIPDLFSAVRNRAKDPSWKRD
jgi:hypothetical protein